MNISIIFLNVKLDLVSLLFLVAPIFVVFVALVLGATFLTFVEFHVHINDFLATLNPTFIFNGVVHELLS